ncbi:MAG: hypothetical protein AAGB26_03685 [Planctomycetota bacterium]
MNLRNPTIFLTLMGALLFFLAIALVFIVPFIFPADLYTGTEATDGIKAYAMLLLFAVALSFFCFLGAVVTKLGDMYEEWRRPVTNESD